MITISEAIQVLEAKTSLGQKVPFNVALYSFNEEKNKAGERIELVNATSAGYKHDVVENGIYNIKSTSGKYYPAHLWLIESINGQEIMLR